MRQVISLFSTSPFIRRYFIRNLSIRHLVSHHLFIKVLLIVLLNYSLVFSSEAYSQETPQYKIEVWTDNWFAAFLDGNFLFEDSVSITTERSFNAETHEFSAPESFLLAFILKDFKENDTGLEYIGSRRQQMGDGGFIAQITRLNSGAVVGVSNNEMLCKVIHKAPLNSECANENNPVAGEGNCLFESDDEPTAWQQTDFDDSLWSNATEYTESVVSPKFGYDEIQWDSMAKLVWSDDLVKDNTVLCRMKIKP